MNKKIFIIWGGVEASNYVDFEEYLLQEEFNPYEERVKWWKDNLLEDLWEWYEVIKLPMPNKWFAHYQYWKIMFEKAFPYFGEENIFIGHSLGWSFLLKYLNENTLNNISQIHLVAPAVFDSTQELLGSFTFDKNFENYKKYENITSIYHSKDDDVVPFSDTQYLQKVLEKSKFEIFDDYGHFIFNEHLEALVNNIKTS